MRYITAAFALGLLAAPSAYAIELSFYTGIQEAPHSNVSVTDPSADVPIDGDSFVAGWEGRSLEMPPYYGFRATHWQNANLGYAVEFTHAKTYADAETLGDTGYSELEFTDGLNSWIASVRYRWPDAWGNFTPYVNVGLGISIPYVEVETTAGSSATDGLQFGGFAGAFALGAQYDLNETWGLFGEYRMIYQQVNVDLDGGGSLDTDIITNAINLGVTYTF